MPNIWIRKEDPREIDLLNGKYRICPGCWVVLTDSEEIAQHCSVCGWSGPSLMKTEPHQHGTGCINTYPDCEEESMPETNPERALHFSQGKPGVDQIPPEILFEWAQVFSYGEQKYFRDNWKKGNYWHEFYGSALRHLLKFWLGQERDPESGLPELAMAVWNIAALRYYQIHELGDDDRPRNPFAAGWQIPLFNEPPVKVEGK